MDQARARALLDGERARLERLLAAGSGQPQPADLGGEVDDADRRDAVETGAAVDQLLRTRRAALERAEARLADEADDDEPDPDRSQGIHVERDDRPR